MKLSTFISSLSVLLLLFVVGNEKCSAQQIVYTAHNSGTETEVQQEAPYKSRIFRVRGTPKITVNTISGSIEVFQNPDIHGVKVELYLERSFSLWSGYRNLDNYRIILQQQGDHIIASVEDKRSGVSAQSSDIKFNFVVQTPGNVSTNLRAFNGNIILENVEGHHYLQNQQGDLTIKNVAGEIRAASTMGNIDLENLQGNIYAKTVNGAVNIFANSGEIRVRSVSGNITASQVRGALVSATTSGNIYADFKDVWKAIYLETLSGDIDLFLPTTEGYNIEGKAMDFNLDGLDEATISERNQNFRNLSVVIREGGLPVKLSTMSGQIRVSESQ